MTPVGFEPTPFRTRMLRCDCSRMVRKRARARLAARALFFP